MALTWNEISSITEKYYIPKMADNIFTSAAGLNRALKNCKTSVPGGTSIMQPLNYAQISAAGWYSGYDTLDTSSNETITAAEYAWKFGYTNLSISRAEELKNSSDAAKLKLVENKTKIAEKTMKDLAATAMFNAGTTTNAPIGLGYIMSTSNTVGGISQSSYSWWQAGVDSTTTVLTLAVLQSSFNTASFDSDQPTVIFSNRTPYNAYWNLLQPQQRFTDSESAKGGFTSLLFNGIPWLVDHHCDSTSVYLINENYFHLYIHPQEEFRFEPFIKPVNQNVQIAKVYLACAVGSSNNRMHYGLTAIAS